MMFIWVIVLGVIIWYVTTQSTSSREKQDKSSSAIKILNQRLAKGEIDESTYQRMKRQIEEGKK